MARHKARVFLVLDEDVSPISGYSNKLGPEITAYTIHGKIALKPRIDKLSLTVPIDKKDHDGIKDNLLANAYGAKLALTPDEVLTRHSSRSSGYRYSFDVHLHDIASSFVLEVKPKKSSTVPFMRLELNPNRLGANWHLRVNQALSKVLPVPYCWPHIQKTGYVTRLDVAVDLLGVEMSQLLMDAKKVHPKLRRWLVVGQNGVLESMYLFQKSLKLPKAVAYNKRAELLNNENEPEFGDLAHTRIELRLKPSIQLSQLHTIPNPLAGIKVLDVSRPIKYPETRYHWENFIHRCQMQSYESAIAAIGVGMTKLTYMKASSAANSKVWDSEAIWTHWKDVLLAQGLFAKPKVKITLKKPKK